MDADSDNDLIADITPDVMECLERSKFFGKLDDILSPIDGSQPHESCLGNYKLSESILRAAGFDSSDLGDIFDVLKSKGGFCDCEILYNAAETSRLKAEYWHNQSKHVPSSPPTS